MLMELQLAATMAMLTASNVALTALRSAAFV
jgi:hypothetical protein